LAQIRSPGLGIATVYRYLHMQCGLHSVRRIILADGQTRYAPWSRSWTYIMQCTVCNSVLVGARANGIRRRFL